MTIEIKHKIVNVATHKKYETIKQENVVEGPKPSLARAKVLGGKIYRLKSGTMEHALYVTIADILYDGKKYPFEIFFNTKDPVHSMWTNALTLLISSLFRQHIEAGLNIRPILKNLSQVYDSYGGYWQEHEGKRKFMNSIVAEIADCIQQHMSSCINENDKEVKKIEPAECPNCKENSYIESSGCMICTSCGYSTCG